MAGLSGGAGPAAYSAAKAAVINLTRAASLELAEHRIRVNAICPGPVHTLMNDKRIAYDAQRRGITLSPGLYTLGLKFQWRRASHFIGGVGRDAAFIANRILAEPAALTGAAAA